jgi:hypothetical protein
MKSRLHAQCSKCGHTSSRADFYKPLRSADAKGAHYVDCCPVATCRSTNVDVFDPRYVEALSDITAAEVAA